ncbi:hypothetical protein COY16_05860 [Candidatus Roizmanbacteria bacterium CG_4_10_14_0_2_um_filter_39_13]|uniref:PqqD family protein n=1 Tax=Candidatus Roizmanbacteria bacterium CG_4_10_14_0_2_um_filter_39_13 TaxID=1974825 RepID=A0A2M7TW86_9BACT|nr:MAG: hypothetical protein COY16_05860 [Candidatus Roizmanbacteria bacterium CG_4_10_14_0_2_um_filter_39_13]
MHKFIKNPKYIFQKFDHALLIFDTDNACVFEMNEQAEVILDLLVQGKTNQQMLTELNNVYYVDRKLLLKDINKTRRYLDVNQIVIKQ